MSGTQDDLFSLPGIPDDDEDQNNTLSQEAGNEQDEAGSGQQQQDAANAPQQTAQVPQPGQQQDHQAGQQPAGNAQPNGQGNGAAQAGETVRPDGLVARPDPNNPHMTNLVNPQTGEVVVPGGPAQRFYMQAMQARQKLSETVQERDTIKTQLDAYKAAFDANNAHQLQPTEVSSALRIMADFKKDPISTLRTIMGELHQAGVDLTPILGGGAGQFAPQALEGVIDRKFAPLLAQQQQAAMQAEAVENAKKMVDNFVASSDYGGVHLHTLGQMIQRDGTLTLESAYVRLAEWVAANGYRMDQPLEAQIAARQQQGQQQHATGAQPRPQGTTANQAPLPNARNMSAGIQGNAGDDGVNAQFSHDKTWDAIARDAMREYGLS